MNLCLRLIWLLLTARSRPRFQTAADPSVLRLRVLPSDLDISLHLNNGRYLTLMDLGRMDFLLRSGLWRTVWQRKLTPIVSSVLIRYRREIGPFKPFELETRIIGWRDDTVIFEQVFKLVTGRRAGQTAAIALVRAGLYDRAARAFATVDDLVATTDLVAAPPARNAATEAFLTAEQALRAQTSDQAAVLDSV